VSNIEVIICLVLLFMAVPDFCKRLGRPSLAFSAFVLVGISLNALLAAGAAGLLLGVRSVIHRFWLKEGGPDQAFLLLCPNVTIVALAAKALQARAEAPRLTALLVLTGLFMTVPSLLLLPRGTAEAR
jgi:hypothetical protein